MTGRQRLARRAFWAQLRGGITVKLALLALFLAAGLIIWNVTNG